MSLLVIGSVAFDSIETPSAVREQVLGGSAVYFSYTASYFTPVWLSGVVGEDFPQEHVRLLQSRGIDTAGLQVVPGAKTFYWRGRYRPNMNDRDTLDLQMNVMGQYDPILPEKYRSCKFLFLANGSPQTHLRILEQCPGASLVVADTMDHYIRNEPEDLRKLLKKIDGLVINDGEARLLSGEENLVQAGQAVRAMGPRFVVVKKGEHGALFFSQFETYVLPAFPTPQVVDPTGAGDSFAGGMMGYLARQGDFQPKTLKEALAYGTLAASFTVEDFSLDRLKRLTLEELDQRMVEYKRMLSF
ncbi:MAG: sugar kinase [Pirellulales bacterium]|nr:sugar kinase [Pirellulales bacterium]